MRHSAFSADEIHAATFVRYIEIHDTLGSTNDRAAELAGDADMELPALVVARHQTAGRGRGENTWWSADGALTFSVVLDPAALGIRTASWPQLSLTTAVAVCDALASELKLDDRRAGSSATPAGLEDEPARYSPKPRIGIKWPNDVLIDGRKVCGILIESPGGSAVANNRLIVGIGININNSWRTPPDGNWSGIALCDLTAKQHDLQAVLVGTLQALKYRGEQLASNDSRLSAAWQQLCWLREQYLEVVSNGVRRAAGECAGIDRDGALLLRSSTGTERVYSGSVCFRRNTHSS